MKKVNNRRTALKTMTLGALGTVVFSEVDCKSKTAEAQNTNSSKIDKPLKAVYTAPGISQPAQNGKDWCWGFKMRSFQTNGQFSCTKESLPPKTLGVEPHYHTKLDEMLHVLEETVHVLVGNSRWVALATAWAGICLLECDR